MKIGAFKATYLNAADIETPTTITVRDVLVEEVSKEDRLVLYSDDLAEGNQGIILNKTCLGELERIFGSDDTEDWVGKPCVVFNDKNVQYQGKRVGGIRFREATADKSSDKPGKPRSSPGANA